MRVLAIVGPTASGKSALAVAVARALPGVAEVVGTDSMQVYRGMDIGTAKPSSDMGLGVPPSVVLLGSLRIFLLRAPRCLSTPSR